MDAAEYRRICERPDVMARRFIRAAQIRLANASPGVAASLEELLSSDPIPKPGSHESGSESDFFWLDLSEDVLEEVVSSLGDLEAQQAQAGAPRLLVGTTGELLDRWNNARSSRPSV